MIELFAVFVSGWLLVSGYANMNDCLTAASLLRKEDGVKTITCTSVEGETYEFKGDN